MVTCDFMIGDFVSDGCNKGPIVSTIGVDYSSGRPLHGCVLIQLEPGLGWSRHGFYNVCNVVKEGLILIRRIQTPKGNRRV